MLTLLKFAKHIESIKKENKMKNWQAVALTIALFIVAQIVWHYTK